MHQAMFVSVEDEHLDCLHEYRAPQVGGGLFTNLGTAALFVFVRVRQDGVELGLVKSGFRGGEHSTGAARVEFEPHLVPLVIYVGSCVEVTARLMSKHILMGSYFSLSLLCTSRGEHW